MSIARFLNVRAKEEVPLCPAIEQLLYPTLMARNGVRNGDVTVSFETIDQLYRRGGNM